VIGYGLIFEIPKILGMEMWQSEFSVCLSAAHLEKGGKKFGHNRNWRAGKSVGAMVCFINVLNPIISEILQALLNFLKKFVNSDEMKLYNSEIKVVKAMNLKKFPDALTVSSKEFKCESIEDKLTEIPALLEFMKNCDANSARE